MNSIHSICHELWYRRDPSGWRRSLLLAMIPPSWAYGAATALRNRRYDSGAVRAERLPRPVVSIGNITVGGTGKTPMAILVARGLLARGFHPAVLSRGYGGRRSGSGNVVSDGRQIFLSPAEGGDEPALMAASLPGVPVITGPERSISGRLAIDKFAVDVLVLDDGFQHRRLARDVDILMIDGQNPFGNRRLLPAGPLREDPRTALDRADIVVKTVVEKLPGRPSGSDSLADSSRPVFRAAYEATGLCPGDGGEALPPKILQDKKILAFTAIAAPEKFQATLKAMGARIIKFLAFPDHYFYKERDVQKIAGAAKREAAEMIVTTEKDGVKLVACEEFYRNIHVLSIGLRIDPGEEAFFGALIKLMPR